MTPTSNFDQQPLDLEAKLYSPTIRLYENISTQVTLLMQDIREALLSAHSTIAATAQQLYAQPGATLSSWYEHVAIFSNAQYALLVNNVIPNIEQTYQNVSIKISDFGNQSWQLMGILMPTRKQFPATFISKLTPIFNLSMRKQPHYLCLDTQQQNQQY